MTIEQAKGVLAERLGISTATAFETMRTAARATRRPLAQVATDIVSGKIRGQVPDVSE